MAVLGLSPHNLCRIIMLFLGLLMIFLNFVLAAAALAKINSAKSNLHEMAVLGMSAHDLCRMVMLVLGLIMVFLNFVLAAAALAKINSTRGTLKAEMAAKPYNEWGPLDWAQYVSEFFAFILIFITFCILCGQVHSSAQVKGCIKDYIAGTGCTL
uniref:Uncharacterized protein n=1 Tax=Panagrolaimus sp. JU765 TaxID=591449 RepID=A0AC34RTL6_9BILA